MAEKIGVYFCEGCDIGKNLDLGELAEFVKNKFGDAVPVVKTHPILCSNDGKSLIQADVDAGAVDGVSVCACSLRVKWDVFNFGESTVVDRVNLREQCVWSYEGNGDHDEGPDDLTLMARDYVNMGVAKLQNTSIPEPEIPDLCKTILVLGGGFTGLTAALDAAKTGHEVVLVEKEAQLGGFAAKMYKSIPKAHPYAEAEDTGIEQKISDVQANGKITVLTGATLKQLKGAPGEYEAIVTSGSGEQTFPIGAVVLATGWIPQDTKVLEPYGYGKFKNVITSVEMEAMAKNGKLARPLDGKPVSAVAFVEQCPVDYSFPSPAECAEEEPEEEAAEPAEGEEGEEEDKKKFIQKDMEGSQHMPMSSGISGLVALKQARYVRELNDNAMAFVIYENMTAIGVHELYYKAAQDDPGVMLTKGYISGVEEDDDGGILLTVANSLLGGSFEVKVDLLVIATGIVPTTAKDPILNLEYRQGPAFPDLDLFFGYADSNYICFPYETRRTGVYAAGCVRQPMLMGQAEDDAAGAVLKAVQCIHSANHGVAVHPRSGDLTFPVFNFVRCTQCKRCTEECPFGALDEDEKGTPKPNPTRCRRCGTCMGACPERVISFDNYNIGMIGSMIKEIHVPDNMEEGGPRVLILACENDAYPTLDMAAFRGKKWNRFVRVIPVRCLGSVNAIWVADAMSKGVDGVMLIGCKYGDDYQCHFVKGSELCNRRKTNIAETLERLGVEPERVEQYQVAIDEYNTIPDLIDEFMEMILEKGPNPFKGY